MKKPKRDPKRIPKILKRLERVWRENPDLRLSQLFWNVIHTNIDVTDQYYCEDWEFIQLIERVYYKK